MDNAAGGKAIANGSVFSLGLNLRLLFRTEGHFGLNFWYRYLSYNYKKGTVTDNYGNKANFKLDGPGNNFGLGLAFRFF